MNKICFETHRIWVIAILFIAMFGSSGCEDPPEPLAPRFQTFAELRVIRRGITVTPPGESARAPYPKERLSDGAVVEVAEHGLVWVRRDGGGTLLVVGPAKMELKPDTTVLSRGRAFVEVASRSPLSLTTDAGVLHLSEVRASIDASGEGDAARTQLYVLRGEARTPKGELVEAGEQMRLQGGQSDIQPVLAWEDWTGGLATTDPAAEPAPFGVGTVGARAPGLTGGPRFPLAIQRMDVRVRIVGDFAITEVDQTFFNPSPSTVEGEYRFRTPVGATLHRFGVDRDDGIVWGYVKEKKAAQAQYQAHVYEGSTEDPALLEWDAPGSYRARLYPILPGQSRQVVVRYAEWLGRTGDNGERRLYVYPMAAEGAEESLPLVEELVIDIDIEGAKAKDVRAGFDAYRLGDRIIVQKHDFVPRADLAVELLDDGVAGLVGHRSPHTADLSTLPSEQRQSAEESAKDEADYLIVPIRPKDIPKDPGGLDLAIVIDTSAATDAPSLALARTATRAILSHLGPDDRAMVWAGDDHLRPVNADATKLTTIDDARRRELLSQLAKVERGGASDLGAVLSKAAAMLDPERRGAIVYIGDGRPTVGELSLSDLRERMDKLPRPVRIFALAVGDDADVVTLSGLARGAFARPIDNGHDAARAALDLFEQAERPVWLSATVDLGPDVERVFPRDLGAMMADESMLVIGRIRASEAPKTVRVTGPNGVEERTLSVSPLDDDGDLRRRWAEGRLQRMLQEDAGHAAMVDLGSRQGIITPVTSLYVPTTAEMTPDDRRLLRQSRDSRVRLGKLRKEKAKEDAKQIAEETEQEAQDEPSFFDRVMGSDKAEEEPESTAVSASADNKEGGTGARAKGEEGSMGMPAATAAPSAPMVPSPAAAQNAPAPDPSPEPADEKDMDGANRGRPGDTTTTKTPVGGKGNGEGYAANMEAKKTANAASRAPDDWGRDDSLGGDVPTAAMPSTAPSSPPSPPSPAETVAINEDLTGVRDLRQAAEFGIIGLLSDESGGLDGNDRAQFAASTEGRRGVTVAVDQRLRVASACGQGANVPLHQRVGLWRERLAGAGANPSRVREIYHQALWQCEAPSHRERSRLLSMMLDAIPDVAGRVALWRLMFQDEGTADALYRGIVSRLRTTEDKRMFSAALGLRTIAAEVLEKTLADAKTPADRVNVLRTLVAEWPDDLELAVTLLYALEDAGDQAGAREHARKLRARADADVTVRTEVGELYLRLAAAKPEGPARKLDEAEARRAFGEIVEFAPDDPIARRRLGDLLRAHGWYREATRQYETLQRLAVGDASVALLLAASAEGVGKLEEAVRWTEKGGSAGAPDVSQGPAATARAFAATYLAWGKQKARDNDDNKALAQLQNRLERVLAGGGMTKRNPDTARVTLVWAHPEFHPSLWSNALGAAMPAPEGDVMLGIAQVMVPKRDNAIVEVRLDPTELDRAARLGASATLTVVFDEAGKAEKIVRLPVVFKRDGTATLRYAVSAADGSVELLVDEATPSGAGQ